ncbi:MAG: NAD(P)H-dependent oxidoreductase [Planctomycetes bacterium]|nr:NAD(P)H-dependent oxidoreductase [Planctomycetota bacterium]
MPFTPKILAFSGSSRKDSFNKKLIAVGVAAAKAAGGDVTLIDLRELELPIYDGDLEKEKGLPAGAVRLKQLMLASHGLLISTPEYNSYFPPLVKNAIDWSSRPAPDKAISGLTPLADKVVGIMSASPGALGGMRSMLALRQQFSNVGTIVLPAMFSLARADEAFDDNGGLKDEKHRASVEKLAQKLVTLATKLHG